ncbi:hypothetical protein BMS3Bbin02_01369 [bacterium BMS3Bbin02]|nr:hypothetical protein BMS3Bbin02_01369 [bacterium BMS3Bbin02]
MRKAFRRADEPPRILIVTEKLLTGFGAPILYGMCLDKPIRDHVGIFENLAKALAFDSEDVAGIVEDLEALRVRFESLVGEARSDYLCVGEGLGGDKKVEAVIEAFRDRVVYDPLCQAFNDRGLTHARLTFDTDLLTEPSGKRAEVIIHELVHLKIGNHGALFRSLVRAHLAGQGDGAVVLGRAEMQCASNI